MEIVTRKDAAKVDKIYRDLLKTERHHKHEIIRDDSGRLRWKKNLAVDNLLNNINLNDLIQLLLVLGYDKNSEIYRHLYRSMGYSLFGYWEVFYWEVNNPEAEQYTPPLPKGV